MVRCKPVRNLRKFNRLIYIIDIFTELTAAKLEGYINSTWTSLNQLVNNVWVHREHIGSYGRPRDSYIIDCKELQVRDFYEVGERYNLSRSRNPSSREDIHTVQHNIRFIRFFTLTMSHCKSATIPTMGMGPLDIGIADQHLQPQKPIS